MDGRPAAAVAPAGKAVACKHFEEGAGTLCLGKFDGDGGEHTQAKQGLSSL